MNMALISRLRSRPDKLLFLRSFFLNDPHRFHPIGGGHHLIGSGRGDIILLTFLRGGEGW